MMENIIDPANSIATFYVGQSIFLTGATGFLGKVYIEKILRSCPDVREIFVLLRPKKGLSINERLEKILNLPLYNKLREEQPSNFKKIIPISGNVIEENLGISAADRQMLTERVTIIIHSAASIKFNDSLKYAILNNTRSTRDICILAQSMKNLIALVYVSTTFAHINNNVVKEKIYPPPADWRKMIKMVESLDEHIINIFTTKFLNGFPNTYVYSKNLAEAVIGEYSLSLPCAIIRPSIVSSSINDPFPGWIDNFYGIGGVLIGGGKGILRVFNSSKHICLDVVPVDVVIKSIIITTWKLGLTTVTTDQPYVLNCASFNQKRLSLYAVNQMGFDLLKEIPLEGIPWTPNTILTDSFSTYYILTILLHILPAILIDLILKLMKYRPMLIKLQRSVYVANCALKHFVHNEWEFENENALKLLTLIPPKEEKIFSFDLLNTDVKHYYRNGIIGSKLYLLHEDMNRLDAAKTHYKRMVLFVTTLKTIIVIGLLWMMYKWYST